jgi:pyruvate/2-oxoglutarate dehydrogenase complex dihydrolipoamide dehydrogenase (E3) component
MRDFSLLPADSYNRQLLSHVHPPDWIPPKPATYYHLVVIGAGPAGLVAAAGAASLGARVALCERHFLGGDCLNTGCVPSKALLRAARAAAQVRDGPTFGVNAIESPTVDFPAVMERMRRLRSDIAAQDSAARFSQLGVDVFFGTACFASDNTVRVAETDLRFKKAVIATGTRARVPSIPGLDTVDYLTNETIFSLTELPQRLAIIGAGPIGCELAQAFARFGSEVHLLETAAGILPREERDAAQLVATALADDGVHIVCAASDLSLSSATGKNQMRFSASGKSHEISFSHLLVAAGRAANVEGLHLDRARVNCSPHTGVQVNDRLQTTNPRIYAAGDICSKYKFTHAADAMARIVIGNALFGKRGKVSRLIIPWCTYTSPEIARIGLSAEEAAAAQIPIDTYRQPLAEIDRSILDGHPQGFIEVHTRRGTDTILGATIVAEQAGELVGEFSLAMSHGLGLKKLATTIHPYPTVAAGLGKLGDQYNRTRLTPWVKYLMRGWFALSK